MENRSPPLYKRIVPLLCTFAVLVSIMAFPAIADDSVRTYIDILDYEYPNGGNSMMVGVSSASPIVQFDMPYTSQINFIDCVVYITSQVPTGCNLVYTGRANKEKISLELVAVGNNTYRIYGDGLAYAASEFGLEFTYGSGITATSWVTFKSIRVSLLPNVTYLQNAAGYVFDLSYSPMESHFFSFTSNGTQSFATWTPANAAPNGWRAELPLTDWRKYDYIDVLFSAYSGDIESVNVIYNYVAVPIEVSFVNDEASSVGLTAGYIRIDLTELDKALTGDVLVEITGLSTRNIENTFGLQGVTGYVTTEDPSLLTYWFRQLNNWLTSVNSTIALWGQRIVEAVGGNADTSQMQEDVGNIKDQMQSASDAMNDFTRPNVGEVITDVELDIGAGTPFADMMAKFFENEFIVSIITGSLAFTLFGIIVG